MSDWPSIFWLIMLGAWGGFYLRVWGEKRMANRTHLTFAQETIACAKKLLTTRKLVGPGPSITNESVWTIEGVGTFKISIAVVEEALPSLPETAA